MFAIIDFVLDIFSGIINILNTRFFSDINITFLQVILVSILIKYIIKFMFGGFKEVDTGANFSVKNLVTNSISNNNRKMQIIQKNGVKIHTSSGSFVLDRKSGNIYRSRG